MKMNAKWPCVLLVAPFCRIHCPCNSITQSKAQSKRGDDIALYKKYIVIWQHFWIILWWFKRNKDKGEKKVPFWINAGNEAISWMDWVSEAQAEAREGNGKKRKWDTVGNCPPKIDEHGEKQAEMKESFIEGKGFLTWHHFTRILRMFCTVRAHRLLLISQHPCGNTYPAVKEWFQKNHRCSNKIRSTTAALTATDSIIGHKEQ